MVDVSIVVQNIVTGLVFGGSYALIAIGMSLTFRVTGVLNLAHGDFITLGGIASYLLVVSSYLPSAVKLVLLILMFPPFLALGMVFERVLIRPVMKRRGEDILISGILITIGFAFIVEDLIARSFGSFKTLIPADYLNLQQLTLGSVSISSVDLLGLSLIVLVTAVLFLYLKLTFVGKAMRAITDDREAVAYMGVPVAKISMLTFGVGTALAAAGGVIFALTKGFSAYDGLLLTVAALSVMVLGGVESILGPLIGGFVIGFAQQVTLAYPPTAFWGPSAPIIMLILVLLIRPKGITGGRKK